MRIKIAEGWAITQRGKLVLFDARHPVYWRRYIAVRVAEEHKLMDYEVVKVTVRATRDPVVLAGREPSGAK